jgi:hypothetical protein
LHDPSRRAGHHRSRSPCLARSRQAAVASRLGVTPRQLNPEIGKCRARQQSRWPPQSFSAPSRHRPRPCIAAPAMPVRRPIIRGAPSPPVMQVAPSPPAIARRPVLPASQGTTPGDERVGMDFASLEPSHALSFLMLAPLFIWFAADMTRKELTDFVGEKVG